MPWACSSMQWLCSAFSVRTIVLWVAVVEAPTGGGVPCWAHNLNQWQCAITTAQRKSIKTFLWITLKFLHWANDRVGIISFFIPHVWVFLSWQNHVESESRGKIATLGNNHLQHARQDFHASMYQFYQPAPWSWTNAVNSPCLYRLNPGVECRCWWELRSLWEWQVSNKWGTLQSSAMAEYVRHV